MSTGSNSQTPPRAEDNLVALSGRAPHPVLSVVLPMHDEAANLDALFGALEPVLARIGLDYEIVCVDDGSRDDTYARLRRHRDRNRRIKLVRFSRNFGKEAALTAGLRHAAGRAVVLMDSDLQHPPDLIETFVREWRAGGQMIYARRESRSTDGPVRRLLTGLYYRLYHALSETDLPPDAGDFRLLDRAVVDAVNALPERQRFMKGLMSWVGFRQIAVPYTPAERHAGASKFSFIRLLRLAMDGLASFSTLPLRIWSWVGLAVAVPAMIYGSFIIIRTLILGVDVPGYASIMVTMLFLGGVQLICLGVMGDYLGRVFAEVKGRPTYLLSETAGFEQDNGAQPLDRAAAQ